MGKDPTDCERMKVGHLTIVCLFLASFAYVTRADVGIQGNVVWTVCDKPVDMILLFDTSGSMLYDLYTSTGNPATDQIAKVEFDKMVKFVRRLVKYVSMGNGAKQTQVSAITVSDEVTRRSSFSGAATLTLDWLNFTCATGTLMHKAFSKINDNAFTPASGARDNSEKVVVVMTDGGFETKKKFKVEADALRTDESATIYPVFTRVTGTSLGTKRRRNLLRLVNDVESDLFDPSEDARLKSRIWQCQSSNPLDLTQVNLQCSYILGITSRFNCTWNIPTNARAGTQWTVKIWPNLNIQTKHTCPIATPTTGTRAHCVLPSAGVSLLGTDTLTVTLSASKGEDAAAKRFNFTIDELKVPGKPSPIEIPSDGGTTYASPTSGSVLFLQWYYRAPDKPTQGSVDLRIKVHNVRDNVDTMITGDYSLSTAATTDGLMYHVVNDLELPSRSYGFSVQLKFRFAGSQLWGEWSDKETFTWEPEREEDLPGARIPG